MKDLQELGRQITDRFGKLGFKNIEFFVDITDRNKSRAEIRFMGEEGKARSFQSYIQECHMHYASVTLGIESSPASYNIKMIPVEMKHESERRTNLTQAMHQLIKDIDNYHLIGRKNRTPKN